MPPAGAPVATCTVLTRRGRLVVTVAITVVAIVMIISVQAISAGSATPDGAAAGPGPSTATDVPAGATTSAATDPTDGAEVPLAMTPPVRTTAPSGGAAAPVVVNGRRQPPAVTVPTAASGQLQVVPGSTPPVTGERVWTYRVEVEQGLPFDGAEFAAAVQATLSDPRGWATDGNVFQRVDTDDVDFRLLLASPDLTDQLCAPLQTNGRVSCRNGESVILNALRWGVGIEDYAGDVASYREYLVNHEVGHRLGRSHSVCGGSGQPAPVMMQQTYGLDGCTMNTWPLPGE